VKRSVGKYKRAFSLVEVMMAIVLASVALSVGFSLLTVASAMNSRTEVLLAANAAAFAKVQEYENKTFGNISVGDSINNYEIEDFSSSLPTLTSNLVKSGTAKVYSQYHNDTTLSLLKVRVVIDFPYGSTTRKIEYGTYIQMGGVGR
jgi:prepilin-type N-terminal cleavage/methylation domain-containing protein